MYMWKKPNHFKHHEQTEVFLQWFSTVKWGIIAVFQMADKEKPAMYWIG